MQLENKIALVTGGNSGIGFGTARRLIEEGATVYITGRRKDALDDALAQLGAGARGPSRRDEEGGHGPDYQGWNGAE